MKRFLIGILALVAVWVSTETATAAERLYCSVCSNLIHGKYYYHIDYATGDRVNFCTNCSELKERCSTCRLPVKDYQTLPDGRFLCQRDFKNAVRGEDAAKAICADVQADIDRMLARWMSYPRTNVLLSIVDRFYLENVMQSPSDGQVCASIFGVTCTRYLDVSKHYIHTIAILSDLLPVKLRAVCAHEYTHAWMGENVSAERRKRMDKDTVEAFCELVAYKYMASRNETNEMAVIRRNDYTKGKIDVLIAAEEKFGFDAVFEWVKGGDDATFTMDTLERVRAVQGSYVARPSNALAAFYALPAAAPVKVAAPTTLMLKGISGTSQRRYALINNTTFEAMERAKISLGQSNVVVQCLEIGQNYAMVQVNGGTKERLELKSGN